MSTADENLALVKSIYGTSPTPSKITSQTSMFNDKDWDAYWGPRSSNSSYDKFMPRSSGSPSNYGSPYNVGYNRTATNTQKKIGVMYPNGVVDTYYLTWESTGWYPFGQEHFEEKDGRLLVPVDRCSFTYAEPKFNACVYTATNDYMQARWGRKLDDSDRRWLARHPYATDGGVPQEYTATCVDQLVAPYGLRVSRIRLRRGSLVLGDSVMAWMISLGVNPLALADRQTSNADAAEKMGMTLEQANQLWRVEFADEPLPCSIIGEKGWTNSTGVSVGSFGGHARYLAPRSRAGDWFISLQLEADDRVSYLTPPPNPEYVERQGDPTLIVHAIKKPGSDEPVAIKTGTTWHRPGESPTTTVIGKPIVAGPPTVTVTPVKPAAPTSTTSDDPADWPDPITDKAAFDAAVAATIEEKDGLFRCEFCSSYAKSSDSYADVEVCDWCAREAWSNSTCPHCEVDLGLNPPHPMQVIDEYEFCCTRCKETIVVPLKSEKRSDAELIVFCEEVFGQLYARGVDIAPLDEQYGPADKPPTGRDDQELLEYYGYD